MCVYVWKGGREGGRAEAEGRDVLVCMCVI